MLERFFWPKDHRQIDVARIKPGKYSDLAKRLSTVVYTKYRVEVLEYRFVELTVVIAKPQLTSS